MSRTIAEVESSLRHNRQDLSAAINDLRDGVTQGTKQVEDLKALALGAPEQARTRAKAMFDEELGERGDQLAVAAVGVGFVAGGGIGAVTGLPSKVLRIIGISSGSEIVVKRDKHSRQVGRALAAVAAADRQVRRPHGFLFTSVKRLAFVAPVIAGLVALMAEEDQIPEALVEPREKLLETIFAG